jgi:Skp family chaperone for outer membrane proteins
MPGERELHIRYVNMPLIYEYSVHNDQDAKNLKSQRADLSAAIDLAQRRLQGADEVQRKSAQQELDRLHAEGERLRTREEFHKQRLLGEINRAMASVASRLSVDFIFSTGDALVYYRKEHDVTEAVLRELAAIRKRNAPAAR